jgi:hypothetical protein
MAMIWITTNNDTQMELKWFLPNTIMGNFTNVLQNGIARDAIQVQVQKINGIE